MGYFSKSQPPEPRFQLGRTVASRGVTELVTAHGINLVDYLARHHQGDWGDLCDEDKQINEDAIQAGDRILSKYHIPITEEKTVPIYVITESDRSLTTILLTSEY